MDETLDAIGMLPALVALLETENVTTAATRLGVGQPAMSRTLARLREVTGDPLLVRVGRGVARTRRADELLPQALESLERARRTLAKPEVFEPATARGSVGIAIGDDLTAIVIEPLLVRLREAAPGIDVRAHALSPQSLDDARRGRVDVVVSPDLGRAYGMPALDDFVRRPIYPRRFVAVTRRRRALDLDAFCAADHLLVSPGGTDRGYVDESLAAIGRSRRVAVTVPTFSAAIAIVARTDLVATLPEDVVRSLAPRLVRRPCPVPTPEFPVCVVYPARMTSDPRHRWLRHEVEAVVRRSRTSSR